MSVSTADNMSHDRDFIETGTTQMSPVTEADPVNTSSEQMEPNESVFDTLEEKSESDTRIYCNNIRGIDFDKDGGTWNDICGTLKGIQADVACLSELNKDTSQYRVADLMRQGCIKIFVHYKLSTSTTSIRSKTEWKPGSTALLSMRDITSRFHSYHSNKLGRWTSTTFNGLDGHTITIVSAYQPCKNKKIGSFSVASQQETIRHTEALEQGTERQSARKLFIADLLTYLTKIQANDGSILLVGDFNEAIGSNTSGMAKISRVCKLGDAFLYQHGINDRPATWHEDSKRIDYALASPSIMHAITACGYDPFGYRIDSDHRGFFMDFNTEKLFRNGTFPMAPLSKRDFTASDPKNVVNYIIAKGSELSDHHNLAARITALNSLTEPNDDLAKQLDRDMVRASNHAAKTCRKQHQEPWSPALAKGWGLVHYYKVIFSMHKTGRDTNAVLERIKNKFKILEEAPTTMEDAQTLLKKAQTELKQIRKAAESLREAFLDRLIGATNITDDKN